MEISLEHISLKAICEKKYKFISSGISSKELDDSKLISLLCHYIKENKNSSLNDEFLEEFQKNLKQSIFGMFEKLEEEEKTKENLMYYFMRLHEHITSKEISVVTLPNRVNVAAEYEGCSSINFKIPIIIWYKEQENIPNIFLISMKNYSGISTFKNSKQQADKQLEVLLVKKYLKNFGSGDAVLHYCFLENDDDKNEQHLPLDVSGKRTSHIMSVPIHVSDADNISKEEISLSISLMDKEKECNACFYRRICKEQALDGEYLKGKPPVKELEYQLPEHFTEEQEKVVYNHQGAARVIACAGSGKTTVLIAKVKNLLEKGEDPRNILILTFSRKAVQVMKNRLFCILGERAENIIVQTINGYAYDILKKEKDALEKNVILLSKMEQKSLIYNLLLKFPIIKGLEYKRMKKSYGTVSKVMQMIEEMEQNPYGYKEKIKKVDIKDMENFYKFYKSYITDAGYISFDEQISLCLDLFHRYPNILKKYQHKYVICDEYQDCNVDNHIFVTSLAQKYKNICVVGDDDQSIYEFRGGSSQFLTSEFIKNFPDCKTYYLTENFRCSKQIVDGANQIVALSKKRLEKKVTSNNKGKPISFISGCNMEQLKAEVDSLIKQGISYSDIAIIARTNKVLYQIYDAELFPSQIAKSYLREDPFFAFLQSVLHICFYGISNSNMELVKLCALFHIDISNIKAKEKSLWKGMKEKYQLHELDDFGFYSNSNSSDKITILCSIISELLHLALIGTAPTLYIKKIVEMFQIPIEFDSVQMLLEWVSSSNIKSLKQFSKLLDDSLDFNDERRITHILEDRVTLVTAHDSKGAEWPVTIIFGVEDFGIKENNNNSDCELEEELRSLYVAMTRAKHSLIIFGNIHSKKINFLNEILLISKGGNENEEMFAWNRAKQDIQFSNQRNIGRLLYN